MVLRGQDTNPSSSIFDDLNSDLDFSDPFSSVSGKENFVAFELIRKGRRVYFIAFERFRISFGYHIGEIG